MAVLTGYAIPTQVYQKWDHTYVLSDDGFAWPCWGRSADGNPVCSGNGDSSFANCLSQPNSHAGIRYGITGVCHQTANRILYPAGVMVNSCGGYGVSAGFWGDYGRGAWPELVRCGKLFLGTLKTAPRTGQPRGLDSMDTRQADQEYATRIQSLHRDRLGTLSDSEMADAELEIRFDVYLGSTVSADQREAVKAIMRDARNRQAKLGDGLDDGKISDDDYVTRVNALIVDSYRRCEQILGREVFQTLFGGPPDAAENLVDRDTFLQSRAEEA